MSLRAASWDLREPEGEIPPDSRVSRIYETIKELPCSELTGHGEILVRFSEPMDRTLSREGDLYVFGLPALGVQERAENWDEAERLLADRIASDVNRLTRAFPYELSEDERAYRAALLAHVDLLGGEIGIDFPEERWLLGRVRGSVFTPVQDDFAEVPIPAALQRASNPDALWFARVATFRDGSPKGEILELEPAPSDGSVDEEA